MTELEFFFFFLWFSLCFAFVCLWSILLWVNRWQSFVNLWETIHKEEKRIFDTALEGCRNIVESSVCNYESSSLFFNTIYIFFACVISNKYQAMQKKRRCLARVPETYLCFLLCFWCKSKVQWAGNRWRWKSMTLDCTLVYKIFFYYYGRGAGMPCLMCVYSICVHILWAIAGISQWWIPRAKLSSTNCSLSFFVWI